MEGADQYQVFHGPTANPPLIGTIQAGDTLYEGDYPDNSLFFPVTRAAQTTYFWRIVAGNTAGVTSSPLWQYTTR